MSYPGVHSILDQLKPHAPPKRLDSPECGWGYYTYKAKPEKTGSKEEAYLAAAGHFAMATGIVERALVDHGYSRRDLARELGVVPQTVDYWMGPRQRSYFWTRPDRNHQRMNCADAANVARFLDRIGV